MNSPAINQLSGVGPKTAERLARIGINSVQDLLFHLPLRYEDRTQVSAIAELQINSSAQFEGEIRAVGIVPGRRRSLSVRVQDGTGLINLRFFHFSAAQKNSLKTGARIRAFGEIRPGRSGLECIHPQYNVLEDDSEAQLDEHLNPVYPSTEGLHQASFRKLINQAINWLVKGSVSELLPQTLLPESKGLNIDLKTALLEIHRPASLDSAALLRFQRRLAFEELCAHHLSLLQLRQAIQRLRAPSINEGAQLKQAFMQQLGFQLTGAQQRVCADIAADFAKQQPMLRLVQGDVGSGKTVVAAIAAAQAIASGYQVVMMAPTEILAEQHYRAFSQWFEALGYRCATLSGQLKAAQRREQLALINSGEAKMIVGTHALIQDSVDYAALGLLIIDEQHRFGVQQRLALRKKALDSGLCPHQIIMTATPIPRTLAMTAYADLDVSLIDELPPGRTPVTTTVLDNGNRARIIERVHKACQEGRQAYWVCTLIEESEALQCQAAEVSAAELCEALPDLRIALIHGRLKANEKAAIMADFKAGHIHLLVATTVIEVGVDVPNASLMIIENAERLGLSQIHQLRGRVGRGDIASHCVLLYQSPLSQNGRQRLETLRASSDGFYIAEQDLALRGPGELLGTRQTGMAQYRIADIERDEDLLPYVEECAQRVLQHAPQHVTPLIERWLGEAPKYANA